MNGSLPTPAAATATATAFPSAPGGGRVLSLSVGEAGREKSPVSWVRFRAGQGVEGDQDASSELRQVGVLLPDLPHGGTPRGLPSPGHCGEHLRIAGVAREALNVGDLLKVGKAVLLLTKVGKRCGGGPECTGEPEDCPVAANWMFARVLGSGQACVEDEAGPATHADVVPVPAGR